jgi:hypothetical protein
VVTRACLDGQAYEELCRDPELRILEKTGRRVLSELAAAVGAGSGVTVWPSFNQSPDGRFAPTRLLDAVLVRGSLPRTMFLHF